MDQEQRRQKERNKTLPIAKNEDVEFSSALADEDDREAQERAEAADDRQEGQL